MKRILLLCSLILCLGVVRGQVFYSQDFEGTGLPTGWNQTTMANDGGWNFGTNTQLQSQSFPIVAHTKMAATNDDACNCNKSSDLLYTMSIDLSSAGSQVFMSYECFYFNLTYQGVTEEAKIVVSIDAGTTWTDVTVVPANGGTTWQTNFVDLSAFSGNADVRVGFLYDDGGGWLYGWAIDDISVFSPATGVDLAVSTVAIGKTDPTPAFTDFVKYVTGLLLDVQVTVSNVASMDITSFDVSWTDGTNMYNQTISGVNISSFQQYTFMSTTPYTTLAGNQSVDVTISNVNSGATELSTANNTEAHAIEGVSAHPDAHYVAEEGTGTWCGWCPRGDVFMHYMRESYPNEFVGVAVHNGDPMTVAAYDGGLGISAFPAVRINRQATIDPSELEFDFIDRISTAPPVVISGTAVYNASTSELTVDLTGNFTQALNGDFRFSAVLKEDSVHVISSGYNQVNYYANNAAGLMGGFENMPATISSALMYYDFVGRALMGTFSGQAGSLPASIAMGSTHSYQFTYTVPATFATNFLTVSGFVLNGSNGYVLNAIDIPVVITTGINEASTQTAVSLYPNPVTDRINLVATLANAQEVTITITDAVGNLISSSNKGMLGAGVHFLEENVSSLSSGIYMLSVETSQGITVKKFTK